VHVAARSVPASRVLFASALVIATCGLVYELVAGALASYLLGDSVTQFSLIIGCYLSAMGVGSYLSRLIDRALLARFVEIEVAIALIGGFEAPLLYAAFVYTDGFRPLLLGLVGVIGILVGLELPLLIRILEKNASLRELVARVLFLDYIGALAASLAFPLVVLPQLGILRASLVFGILNAAVALWTTFLFEAARPVALRLRVLSAAALIALIAGLVFAGAAEKRMEQDLFADPVVLSKTSPYQRIVVTSSGRDTRLFLNGALQFSTLDEYRYHEALVHPVMAAAARRENVLILGGGDGLAAREVLRWPDVGAVTLVDLDPAVTGLFADRDELARINQESLRDERVTVVGADAFTWMQSGEGRYDAIIIDFPDPSSYAVSKLYTSHFYRLLRRRLADGGAIAVQSTSPFFSPEAYWCIMRTMRHEGFTVRPYHAYVPAFGEWGFALAGEGTLQEFSALPSGLRFLDAQTLAGLFIFPPDMRVREGPINRLDNQILVQLYESDWRKMVAR